MLSKIDKKIISVISQDIPLVREPFRVMAGKLGMGEEGLLKRIRVYKKRGFLRKFSAAINHKKIGFRYNAMAVWNIPEENIDEAAAYMVSLPEVSHCYQRKTAFDWNYNLYSMIHGRTKAECLDIVRNIAGKTVCKDYRVLFSSEEYKKSSANYF